MRNLILLGCLLIAPTFFNLVYLFIIVKLNLWHWIPDFVFRDCNTDGKIDEASFRFSLIPPTNFLFALFIVVLSIGSLLYFCGKILFYPVIKIGEFIFLNIFNSLNKVEEKREFYREINQ